MSKLLANQIANYNDNGPVEVKEGINLPTGKPFQVAGGSGSTGQYLRSTGTTLEYATFPTIPSAQVQTDWNATSGMGQILNKPTLATVAESGSYNDLSNKPNIPAAQVNSDWTATTGVAAILNKPSLFDGAYTSLTGAPPIPATLNDLADVNIVSPGDGEYVQWDQATTRWVTGSGSAGLLNIVEDTTPQLGGDLDANGKNIDMGSNLITDGRVGEWNNAFAWGNHAAQGYLTSYTNTTYSQQAVGATGGVNLRLVDSAGAQDDITITAGAGITIDQIGTEGFRINSTGGGGSGGGATVTTADSAPATPLDGDLWWKSNEGRLKVYYDDGSGTQWVDASPPLSPSFAPEIFDSSGTARLTANGNQHDLSGHIIPTANATYDLGNAEFKIRHLFLSDNSMWVGEDSKVAVHNGKVKFYNRDKSVFPTVIAAAGGTLADAKQKIEAYFTARTSIGMEVIQDPSHIGLNEYLWYWCDLTGAPLGTYTVGDLYPPEIVNGDTNPNFDPADWADQLEFGQNGKRVAPFLTDDAEEYKLIESDTFIRSNVLADFPVKVIGCLGTEKNYFDMIIFVPQGNTPRTMTTLSIDGTDAVQVKITGTPEANTTQTFKINALFLGNEWKATVAIG